VKVFVAHYFDFEQIFCEFSKDLDPDLVREAEQLRSGLA
jgi:hypothetical protein